MCIATPRVIIHVYNQCHVDFKLIFLCYCFVVVLGQRL